MPHLPTFASFPLTVFYVSLYVTVPQSLKNRSDKCLLSVIKVRLDVEVVSQYFIMSRCWDAIPRSSGSLLDFILI